MKKKIIIASAIVLFAVATVFNMNLLQGNSLGDVSLESIAVMVQAQTEGSDYHKGTTGKNWKTYTISCTYTNTTQTNTTNSGGSYSSSYGASVPIPNTPVSVSGSVDVSVHYNQTSNTTYDVPTITIQKDVCGSGSGWCWSSAPDGNPCA